MLTFKVLRSYGSVPFLLLVTKESPHNVWGRIVDEAPGASRWCRMRESLKERGYVDKSNVVADIVAECDGDAKAIFARYLEIEEARYRDEEQERERHRDRQDAISEFHDMKLSQIPNLNGRWFQRLERAARRRKDETA